MSRNNVSFRIKDNIVTIILTVFGLLVMVGPAKAICPDGRPEPCYILTPTLTPSLSPVSVSPTPSLPARWEKRLTNPLRGKRGRRKKGT